MTSQKEKEIYNESLKVGLAAILVAAAVAGVAIYFSQNGADEGIQTVMIAALTIGFVFGNFFANQQAKIRRLRE
ncbi:MAG: hypothetical protein KKA79_07545 [Nanoarchaeota archaeon]|nr:hypothetical protein [Nanoarchaeota archaeon]